MSVGVGWASRGPHLVLWAEGHADGPRGIWLNAKAVELTSRIGEIEEANMCHMAWG